MTRTFIALELEAAQQRFLEDMIRQGKLLLPDLHWVKPASIHLTLAFLGELDEQQVVRALAAASFTAAHAHTFAYRFSRAGTFGPARSPRVLWMGVSEPSGTLSALARGLALALKQEGFETDQRPFSPHLTLARIPFSLDARQFALLQQLLSAPQVASPVCQVLHLSVMKSVLLPTGAQYTCLQKYPLPRKETMSG